jgi:uncharacterized membrane protein YgaE (UPF0421/DUF939 family)
MAFFGERLGITRAAAVQSCRATVAAVASLVLARGLSLPEFYWAPISAIVIMLSTIEARTLGWQRFVGTGLGAALGAVIATWFEANWLVYGVGMLICGMLCAVLRVGSAYRFAAIALTIVLLVAHTRSPWIVALHRFIEVSLGIAVALAVALVWRAPAS